MIAFIRRLVGRAPRARPVSTAWSSSEADMLRRKIKEWEARLSGYEKDGHVELARSIRESLPLYRRKLAALEHSPSSRVA